MSLNNEVEVGKLKKHYSGFMREMYSNADKFSVSCNFITIKSIFKTNMQIEYISYYFSSD